MALVFLLFACFFLVQLINQKVLRFILKLTFVIPENLLMFVA